ncbi:MULTISPECIES: cytochrome c biogenesis protein CcdA [unclassified Methanoculleus]|uniref:cytochrome c biogenesis CcdA family protein n=1 Tax=unclassified Methanoculleus TaxID=2619537 RepID=UPI0025D8D331|nr:MULTISPECIES: cytochrome c biogenesis protein CcdA [unclassified Methanoculleus]MCK9317996.1 sulfite exporter TauE/SafE family protein [Methanoculleus sp.]MDD2254092.1 cytochrome c biogenesis protein CcdA [Methanoculleus sp.]MDD2786877.1 cytochrome c biogenesis protein CcdA [Methanoculleus sp.]MDD3215349.1 cytochrome c biogenesis protein CcdA [Methanoculleus sp.]MDD4314326.1 cytochrome c biogenesis protein CcdA [Methanoculleus sp.]
MASFDPSVLGVFVFGLVAGICPCNSVLCLGLIGYLTSGKTNLTLAGILKLTVAFSLGTVLVLLPLGGVAGYVGEYLLFLSDTVAWGIGGVLMILMGLQLLHVYKPPIRSIFNLFRAPVSYSVTGAFLLGLSFGAITVGRGAPMLLVVLTYIALYQTAIEGLFTIFVYAVGLAIPLIVISSLGGAVGKRIKEKARVSGEAFDRIVGVAIVVIGVYFLYLAFW